MGKNSTYIDNKKYYCFVYSQAEKLVDADDSSAACNAINIPVSILYK